MYICICWNGNGEQHSYENYQLNDIKQSMGCDKFMNEYEFTIHENGIWWVEKGHQQILLVKDGTHSLKCLQRVFIGKWSKIGLFIYRLINRTVAVIILS